MNFLYLLGGICFIFLHGFFAASEISFISSRILNLRHRKDNGSLPAARVYKFALRPEKFLATALVGTNLCVVLSTSLITSFLIRSGITNSNVWITVFFTPIVVIFAELVPKNIGRYFREDFSCRVVGLFSFFDFLFSWIVRFIEIISRFLVKMFIPRVRPRSPFVTKEEIKSLVQEIKKEGGIDRGEQEAIEEVFEFRTSRARDVCVELKNVVGVDYADSRETIMGVLRQAGFTRYPVFKNRQVTGYINIYDLFFHPGDKWHTLIRPITRVGVNQKLYDIFSLLKGKKESMALVLKGKKIYGVVTLQDLFREVITSIVK